MASATQEVNEANDRVRRRRRSRSEVEGLIENAACTLFAERGFAAATTREIAERADVSETLLFRYFGDKVRLFERTVAAPFDRLMADFLAHRDHDAQGGQRMFDDVYELLVANRRLLTAMMAGGSDAGVAEGNRRCFASFLDLAVDSSQRERAQHGIESNVDPRIAVRLAFGLMTASVLMQDWLFPDGVPPRDEMVDTLRAMISKALDLPKPD